MPERDIYRIIDVNANRAREGLRVIEEVARFIFAEPRFAACLKELRHAIAEALNVIPDARLLSSRDSREDVGRKLNHPGEAERDDYREIIRANAVRSQEALRTLEEFSKVIDSGMGRKFKDIRFQLYSLEKELGEYMALRSRKQSVKGWGLYVILDRELIGSRDPVEIAVAVAGEGVRALQWRDKKGSGREAAGVVSRLKKHNRLKGVDIIINDRVDIALSAGADGVHLGQEDLPLSEARKLLGWDKVIGVSTHCEEEALRAEEEGADYVSLGPVFPTETKKDASSPLGVKMIEEIKKSVKVPLVAIGGINKANMEEVIAAGADVVAVASAVLGTGDVAAAAKDLLNRFKKTSISTGRR